jgi:hypothetical protein
MQPILDVYWDTIYASMQTSALPEKNVTIDIDVRPFLELPVYTQEVVAPVEYKLPENSFGIRTIILSGAGESLVMRLGGGSEHSVELICGAAKWEYNKVSHCPIIPAMFLGDLAVGVPVEIAASWGSDGVRLRIAMQFVTTPHGLIFDFDRLKRTLTISRTIDHGAVPVILSY